MRRINTAIPDVFIVESPVFEDDRGFFQEIYQKEKFKELGINCDFVQDNYSRSSRGVLRGIHYQLEQPQAKLVRVLHGAVYDVAVDVRRKSLTFGNWIAEILSEDNKRALFIPEGFAHGFFVMSDIAEFTYKCSNFYAPQTERGIIWNDPSLKIHWPLNGILPNLSPKDSKYGMMATISPYNFPL